MPGNAQPLMTCMLDLLQENVALAAQGLEVLPGVVELLKALQVQLCRA